MRLFLVFALTFTVRATTIDPSRGVILDPAWVLTLDVGGQTDELLVENERMRINFFARHDGGAYLEASIGSVIMDVQPTLQWGDVYSYAILSPYLTGSLATQVVIGNIGSSMIRMGPPLRWAIENPSQSWFSGTTIISGSLDPLSYRQNERVAHNPEPSTWVTVVAGLLLVAYRVRKSKKPTAAPAHVTLP